MAIFDDFTEKSAENKSKEVFISMKKGSKLFFGVIGLISGFLNGLFGSGGGIAAVPLLELNGLEARKSHATSVALIFFLSLVSAAGYIIGGAVSLETVFSVVPAGLCGAAIGSVLLKNTDNSLLRRIFGALLLYSAWRWLS